jgi:hypothetical protein
MQDNKLTGKERYTNNLPAIVEQLEKCGFQTSDQLHDLEDNVAFIALKDMANAAAKEEAWVRIERRPKVVCFCGSTRFTTHMLILRWEMEKEGTITIGWNVLPEGYGADSHVAEAEGVKELIDELHKRKIDLADEVFVVNLDGYIGESTRSEIDYAELIGKPIRYLEPIPPYTEPQTGGKDD